MFLALKMSQDPVDGVLLLDASDDFDSPAIKLPLTMFLPIKLIAVDAYNSVFRTQAVEVNVAKGKEYPKNDGEVGLRVMIRRLHPNA